MTVELKLGFKSTQFIEAEAKILSRMISFGDAMEGAIAECVYLMISPNSRIFS